MLWKTPCRLMNKLFEEISVCVCVRKRLERSCSDSCVFHDSCFVGSQVLPWTLHRCFSCYAERREGFDTSQTLFAFAEHELPVSSEGGGKSYAAWNQEAILKRGIRPHKIKFVALNQDSVQSH